MAIRSDFTVDWSVSPRIITVDAPSVDVVIQDLHDTCRSLESEPTAMDDKILIQSAGLESLGGGTAVGLTSTLQNALIAFEARTGPSYIQCKVSGGNVVAVDGAGASVDSPISPTAFTQVVITASSSATTQSQAQLEAGVFAGKVVIDTINGYAGTDKTPSGELIGTFRAPSGNVPDAVAIAIGQGIREMLFLEPAVISTDIPSGFALIGSSPFVVLDIQSGADVTGISCHNMTLNGVLDGLNSIEHSTLDSVTDVSGVIFQATLENFITIKSDTRILQCFSGEYGSALPYISVDSGANLMTRDFRGSLEVRDILNGDHSLGGYGGRVVIDSTCTGGNIYVRGDWFEVVDNSGAGCTVLDERRKQSSSGLTPGEQAQLTRIDTATIYESKVINNLKEVIKIGSVWYLIIYDDGEVSGGTEILRKALKDPSGADITDLVAGVLASEYESSV